MARFRSPPPIWFRMVAIILVLWGLIGVYACYMQFRFGAEAMGPATEYDKALYASLPGWYNPLYAVAVGSGVLGAIALVMRSALARPLFLISLVAVVIQFGWLFVSTDVIAQKGAVTVVPFPVFIVVVAAFQIWLANLSAKRGWSH